jgi:hypothetical protein
MSATKDTNATHDRRYSDQFKSWLPIVISIGGIIVGYILFKANTENRLNAAEHTISEIRHELREAQQEIIKLDRTDVNYNSRLKVLERQPIGDLNE